MQVYDLYEQKLWRNDPMPPGDGWYVVFGYGRLDRSPQDGEYHPRSVVVWSRMRIVEPLQPVVEPQAEESVTAPSDPPATEQEPDHIFDGPLVLEPCPAYEPGAHAFPDDEPSSYCVHPSCYQLQADPDRGPCPCPPRSLSDDIPL